MAYIKPYFVDCKNLYPRKYCMKFFCILWPEGASDENKMAVP
jgi:hypothetical protein